MTRIRALLLAAVAVLILGGTTACAEIAPPDEIGLWYMQGQRDGNQFGHCVPAGEVGDWLANNSVFWVPNNVRTWNVAPSGGDTNQALVVTAKPEEGQQSGLEVLVWTQTTMKLNTYCGPDNKSANAPLVQWWQNLGDRYDADTEDGWLKMLNNTVVPALEKAKNVLRGYTADQLVLGSVWAEAEKQFAATFSAELTRLSGGNYFCGPSFTPIDPATGKPWAEEAPCDPVEVSIKDVDYRDAGIQDARNAKQKAEENAAAQVAEAEGRVRAAEAQNLLYQNQAWMELEKARLQLEAIRACSANPNCTIVLGVDGQVLLGQK